MRKLLILVLLLLGCVQDLLAEGAAYVPPASSSSSTSEAEMPTTGGDGIQTVTGPLDDTSGTSTGGTTASFPSDSPPAIVQHELSPDPITANGLIGLSVIAEHADGVRMQLESGDVVELEMIAPDVFTGVIAVYTGFDKGPHVASLTPWRDDVDGETVPASYTVALPEPGSEGFWETGDLIGPGQVVAMGVLPGGVVIEFGTLMTGDGKRCFMRRRDQGGVWLLSDVVPILPDIECAAIDLVVDAEGAMFVLANRKVGNNARWWVARISAWKAEPAQIGVGSTGETAVALAGHPSGMIAACGFAPAPSLDDDARAWIFRPNQLGETRSCDYLAPEKLPHQFGERTRDCVFAGDTLTLVGEANGPHGTEKYFRDRLFILGVDPDAPDAAAWNVAGPGVQTQSGAQAVAVDALGRLVIAGYVCDDTCQPEGQLRLYDLEGDLATVSSLGTFPTKAFAVQDFVWSPAGYAIVATGGMKGNELAFTVRAFDPAKVEPVWTFAHKDNGVLHMALALALGPYGEVYAGGFGENGYPAVAYIGG